jgi:hypothetical protein
MGIPMYPQLEYTVPIRSMAARDASACLRGTNWERPDKQKHPAKGEEQHDQRIVEPFGLKRDVVGIDDDRRGDDVQEQKGKILRFLVPVVHQAGNAETQTDEKEHLDQLPEDQKSHGTILHQSPRFVHQARSPLRLFH